MLVLVDGFSTYLPPPFQPRSSTVSFFFFSCLPLSPWTYVMFLTQGLYSNNFVFFQFCGPSEVCHIRLGSLVLKVTMNNSVLNVTVEKFLYAKLFAQDKLLEVKLLDQGYVILNAFYTYFQITLQKTLYSLVVYIGTLVLQLLLVLSDVFKFCQFDRQQMVSYFCLS